MDNIKYEEDGTYKLEETWRSPMLFIPVEQQTPNMKEPSY